VGRRPKEVPYVLGIDPSLTRSAAVLIPPGWELGDWAKLMFRSVEVPALDPLPLGAESREFERARIRRMMTIAERLVSFVRGARPIRGFIESYAFSASSSSVTKLAELGGIIRARFLEDPGMEGGLPLEPVTASQARKQLLGRLPRKDQKLAVQLALGRVGAPFGNADECDAFTVAAYGLTEVGAMGFSLA
jgi:Holliday junction resolvasome RuvABC endonuclease subunit